MTLKNKVLAVLAASVLTVAVSVPAASAFVRAPEQPPAKSGGAFCAALNSQADAAVLNRIHDGEKMLKDKRDERTARLGEVRGNRDVKLKEVRGATEVKLGVHIAKLLDLAKTDAQKQAVTAFQSAVEAAVKSRQTAADQVKDAFRQELDAAIAARKSAIDAAVKVFSDAVAAAAAKAKMDCTAGSDQAGIRETYKSAVAAAKEALRTGLQNAAKVGPAASTLTETRRQALEKAAADFQVAMDKAKADLKAVFAVKAGEETK